jgi:hypothetical protein
MKNDFDHTGHPTDQLLDPEKTDKTAALIQMKFPNFLCVYPSTLVQESPSKFEMNYNLMVQNYIPLIQILFRALDFHLDFENQGKLLTMILGLK